MRRSEPLKRRTELKRFTRLRPGKGPSRRTRLRRQSKKKRLEVSETGPARKLYRESHPVCECCGLAPSTEVHEIPRGASRQQAVRSSNAWLAVCRECHELLEDYSIWPIVQQVGLKLLRVLQEINAMRAGRPQVSLEESHKAMTEIVLEEQVTT